MAGERMRVPLALFFFFFSYVCLFGHVCFYNRGRKKKKKKRTFFLSCCSPWILPGVLSHCRHKERYKTRGRKEEEETSFVGFTSRLCSSTPSLIVYLFSFYLKREEERRKKKEKRLIDSSYQNTRSAIGMRK
jgi:preprotein translocase subunit YajC